MVERGAQRTDAQEDGRSAISTNLIDRGASDKSAATSIPITRVEQWCLMLSEKDELHIIGRIHKGTTIVVTTALKAVFYDKLLAKDDEGNFYYLAGEPDLKRALGYAWAYNCVRFGLNEKKSVDITRPAWRLHEALSRKPRKKVIRAKKSAIAPVKDAAIA